MRIEPPRAAILGLGCRGRDWARILADAGWRLRLFDPVPGLANATLQALPGGAGRHQATATISAAVADAIWVQECVSERLALKRKLYELVQRHVGAASVLASSTLAFETEALRVTAPRPDQILIARLDLAGPRVRLIRGPGVGAGLLAFAARQMEASGIATVEEPERAAENRKPQRPRVVRLVPTPTAPAPMPPARLVPGRSGRTDA